MNYKQIKKLDEETLEKLTDGIGPSDECLCSLLAPPDDEEKKGIRASIKKAFASFGGGKKKNTVYGKNAVDIPLTFTKGGKGIYTTKEVVKRSSPCGKCGCDSDVVLKHSYANIRITAPDIDASAICPCPSNCLPDLKDKLQNNIKVTIERFSIETDEPGAVSEAARSASEPTVSLRSESTVGERSVEEGKRGESKDEIDEN